MRLPVLEDLQQCHIKFSLQLETKVVLLIVSWHNCLAGYKNKWLVHSMSE